jgi:putative DNA-invertase from lambdoid prophage Rac
MALYGLTRASTLRQEKSPERQASDICQYCRQHGLGEPSILHEELGTSGCKTRFRDRTQGRWLLLNATAGDVLAVTKLDRIGRSIADIHDTLDRLTKRGVRLIVLEFGGRSLDMDTMMGKVMATVYAIVAQIEADNIRERTASGREWRKSHGMWCVYASYGKRKIIDPDGTRRWEWDLQQLAHIAEIAERLGRGEDVGLVAADFWQRGIKDHRGLPWGEMQHKPGKGTGNKYEHYRRATRWFHRAKHRGELPPPYCEVAATIPECPGIYRGETGEKAQRQTGHRRKSRLDGRAVAGVVCLGVPEELNASRQTGVMGDCRFPYDTRPSAWPLYGRPSRQCVLYPCFVSPKSHFRTCSVTASKRLSSTLSLYRADISVPLAAWPMMACTADKSRAPSATVWNVWRRL